MSEQHIPTAEDFTRTGVSRWIVQVGVQPARVYYVNGPQAAPRVTLSPVQALNERELRTLKNARTRAQRGDLGDVTEVNPLSGYAAQWFQPDAEAGSTTPDLNDHAPKGD
jgi:hypothetical protein